MARRLSLYIEWWRKWRTWPVRSWIRAAGYYRDGSLSRAEVFYKKGLAKHPFHPARVCAHLDLAHCLFKARKITEAEYHLRQAISINPSHREGYLRLARLQLWIGHATEAAWTIHAALQQVEPDPELIALYLTAVLERGGHWTLVDDAVDSATRIEVAGAKYPRFETALALLAKYRGDTPHARAELARLASMERGPFEAVIAFAELLLTEHKTAYARHHLHRALSVAPEHPKVLYLLALTYLEPGPLFQPQFAVQLSLKACQQTAWLNPRAMHVLAESYLQSGDKMSALLVASRAKDQGSRMLSTYSDSKDLEELIENLSSGTQV